MVAVPWTTPAGPTGAACATASAGVANRNQVSPLVHPSLLLDKALPYDPANPAVASDPVFQLRTLLLESERYLLECPVPGEVVPVAGPAVHRRAGPVHPGRAGVRDPPTGDGGAHRRRRGPDWRAQ